MFMCRLLIDTSLRTSMECMECVHTYTQNLMTSAEHTSEIYLAVFLSQCSVEPCGDQIASDHLSSVIPSNRVSPTNCTEHSEVTVTAHTLHKSHVL